MGTPFFPHSENPLWNSHVCRRDKIVLQSRFRETRREYDVILKTIHGCPHASVSRVHLELAVTGDKHVISEPLNWLWIGVSLKLERINVKWSVYLILNDSLGAERALDEVSSTVELSCYSSFIFTMILRFTER